MQTPNLINRQELIKTNKCFLSEGKTLKFRLSLCIALAFVLLSSMANAADIWVSVNGSDQNEGTQAQPLASLHMALRKARELRRLNNPSVKGGISIHIGKGLYKLEEQVFIRPEDSGTADSPTTIIGDTGGGSILSGGVKVNGWKKASSLPGLSSFSQGRVWVANAPVIGDELLNFRQLWVNGNKAVRARDVNAPLMSRILSWDKKTETCWIPKPKNVTLFGIKGMEMFIHQWWAVAMLRIKDAVVQGDSVKLSFLQPESRVQSEHPWPAPFVSKKTGNSAFYLVNAIQFLDQPGEWYLDKVARKIYYIPRSNEDLQSAEVVVPYLETLLHIGGTIDNPVKNVNIKNISFQHSTWLLPSRQGLVPHQAGMYMTDAYKLKIPGTPDKKGLENQAWVGRPAAAVSVSYANNTSFTGCRFEHLASTGLDYQRGTQHNLIDGNLFRDIGGTAILNGVFSDEGQEVHVPYKPADMREVCAYDKITNNLINNATNEDWGCVGIGAGYVNGITIAHNDISEVNYSGISVGWGWTKTANVMRDNQITNNRITHYAKTMYDVAAIYTLSAQPGTLIARNYVDSIYKAQYAHDPNHWFYLYGDEGTSNVTVKDNWTPSNKYLQNANGPGNQWMNNGNLVGDEVKKSAGLEASSRWMLQFRIINPGKQPINQHKESKNEVPGT